MPTETLARATRLERSLTVLLVALVVIGVGLGVALYRAAELEQEAEERCARGNAQARVVLELLRVNLELADDPQLRAIAADPLLDYNSDCPVPTGGTP